MFSANEPKLLRRNSVTNYHFTTMPDNAPQFAFACIAVALVVATPSWAACEVKLRDRVAPKSSVVRLGDVAEVVGVDRQQSRRLAAVPLMPAPAPSTQRYLRKQEIADMIAASGFELGEVRFSGAQRVAIESASPVKQAAFETPTGDADAAPLNRHAALLAGKALPADTSQPLDEAQANEAKSLARQAIADYVKRVTAKPEVGEIECSPNDKQLAQLAAAKTAPVCSGGAAPWTGKQKFSLSFATAAGPVEMPVYASVNEAPIPVVVALRAVPRGNPLTAADVEVRRMDPKSAGQRASFDSIEQVLGLEARQPLQPGAIVFSDDVRSPILVKRGELISVAAQGGGIRVRTTAKSLQEGSKGDLIPVESLQTKQRFDVRVAGFREATIFTASRENVAQQTAGSESATRPTSLNR